MDVESFNTDKNDSAIINKRSKGKVYEYCNHYESHVTAHEVIMGEPNYLGYNWKLVRQLPSSSGSTSWYECVARGCQILLQLKINTISDISTIFISSGEHIHDQQNRPTGNLFGIDNKINKTIIIEYERINLKP